MGKATKALQNPYYIARIDASECNDDLSSREGASDITGIDRTRLARIELDTVTPYPDDVCMMAEAYNAPELLHHYCSHDCPIGRCLGTLLPSCQASNIEQLAVQAAIALRNAETIRESLLDISADGVISEEEQPILSKLLAQLGQISQVAHQLQALASKLTKEVS